MGEFYPFRGLPEATPALTALASAFLNRQLRLDGAIHDVADDARAALDVALYEIQKGPSPQLEPPLMKVPQSPTPCVCSRQFQMAISCLLNNHRHFVFHFWMPRWISTVSVPALLYDVIEGQNREGISVKSQRVSS